MILSRILRFGNTNALSSYAVLLSGALIVSQVVPQAPAPQAKVIPLAECYASMQDRRMQRIGMDPSKASEAPAEKLDQLLATIGASNIFLVADRDRRFEASFKRGTGQSSGFVEFTNRVLRESESADYPFENAAPPYWLFVHFGVSHSSPPRWIVQEVSVSD